MDRKPPVPPEESGDDEFDDDDFGASEEDSYERRHKPSKSDRMPRKFRREEERPGPRPKRDRHHGRPSKREHGRDED